MKRWLMMLLVFAAGCAEKRGLDSGGDAGANTGPGTETQDPCGEGAEVGLEVGMCAPEFRLPDSEGVMTSLGSFRGKVALVDIAALW